MKLGISTACYYPLNLEDTLPHIQGAGVQSVEIFLNTESELADEYIDTLGHACSDLGLSVSAIHPYTSGFEHFLFFSGYERREQDGYKLYERYFDAARRLGAKNVHFHGGKADLGYREDAARNSGPIRRLVEMANSRDVTLCQENVVRCASAHPDYIAALSEQVGDAPLGFTFDIKQALRAKIDPYRMIDAMGDRLCHVHISDSKPGEDCLLPGFGKYDLPKLIGYLAEKQYERDLILEVYSDSYGEVREIRQSLLFLKSLLCYNDTKALQAKEAQL
jgi:sugar phosphate isomerase/epimerase